MQCAIVNVGAKVEVEVSVEEAAVAAAAAETTDVAMEGVE